MLFFGQGSRHSMFHVTSPWHRRDNILKLNDMSPVHMCFVQKVKYAVVSSNEPRGEVIGLRLA
jgi:hypothetical protein